MIGERRCFEILESALNYAQSKKPDYVGFLLMSWESCLTRVANSQIHQNVGETEGTITVEVMHDLQIGSASTNLFTEDALKKSIDQAFNAARYGAKWPASLKLEEFPKGVRPGAFFGQTADFSPQDRARILKDIIDRGQASHLVTSAKFQTGLGEIAVVNSFGTMVYTSFTDANISAILTGPYDSSYGAIASPDVRKLRVENFIDGLIRKNELQNDEPFDLFSGKKPGEEIFYDVILEPYAAAEWLDFLAYTGFNGLRYHEEESFLCGKLGQKVLGDRVTIWDDGQDQTGYPLPFDLEGTPKRRIIFVENGIGCQVAYDGLLAAKYNAKTTAHSLGAGQRHLGALPMNMFMAGGEHSTEEMIASSKDPTIYISRFHYTNVADRRNVTLTGMTKDGTFLVEHGEIVKPLVNLRYLQGVVEAFNNITMLSEPVVVHDPDGYGALMPSCTVVPALKIKKVRFIGSTGK